MINDHPTLRGAVGRDVAVDVEAAVHEDEQLADPGAARELVQVAAAVGRRVRRGGERGAQPRHLHPHVAVLHSAIPGEVKCTKNPLYVVMLKM